MELEKSDSRRLKGLAVLFMVFLHLFCRKENLPYDVLFYIGNVPLVYYFALFCDCCVAIFCFCSGYAQYTLWKEERNLFWKNTGKRLSKLIISYWVILISVVLVGIVLNNGIIPRTFSTFLKHCFLLDCSYNGSWWFLLIYILLILFFGVLKRLIEKAPALTLLLAFLFYFIAYLLRFDMLNLPEIIPYTGHLQERIGTFGTSLLPFLFGVYFAQFRVMSNILSWLNNRLSHGKQTALFATIILCLIVAHGFVETLFVAPFTGLVVIIVFHIWCKRCHFKKIKFLLTYFGKHSTNIWLIHMFFYNGVFTDAVFQTRFVPLVFIATLFLSVATSLLLSPIQRSIKTYPSQAVPINRNVNTTREGNQLSCNTNEVKTKCLNILLEIDRICREKQIQYYLYAGSLLGAVRHSGFIPWDDDIDIVMFREDYNKFIDACYEKLDQEHYELQTIFSDRYASNPWIKVHDKNTAFISGVRRKGAMEGINIDIFPIDNAPDSAIVRKWRGRIINALHFIYQHRFQDRSQNASWKMWFFQKTISLIPPWDEMKFKQAHQRYIQKYNDRPTKNVVYLSNRKYERKVISRDCFSECIFMKFEGHEFPVPIGWHDILVGLYGENYMTPPPKEQQITQHGSTIVDTEHSWKDYTR